MKNSHFPTLFLLFFVKICHAQTPITPELRIPAAHVCNEFVFSNDDQFLVTEGQNEVKIWDMSGPFLLKTLRWQGLDTLYSRRMFFSSDKKRVFIHGTGHIRIINMDGLSWESKEFTLPDISNMTVSPDGKWIYLMLRDDNTRQYSINKMDAFTGKIAKMFDFNPKTKEKPDGVGCTGTMEVSPDGALLLAEGYDSGGLLFDLKTGKTLKIFGRQLPMFFTKTSNIIATTYLDYDPNVASVPNPRYLVEEIELNTWKTLRKQQFILKNDDIEDASGVVWLDHDHKNKIVWENNGNFYVFDAEKWVIKPRQSFERGQMYGSSSFTRVSDGGNYLFANSSMEGFSLETGDLAKKVGFFPYSPFNLAQATIGADKGILIGYKHLHFDKSGFRLDLLPMLDGCGDYNWLQRSIYRIVPEQKKVFMVGGGGDPNYRLKSFQLGFGRSDLNVKSIDFDPEVTRNTMEIRSYADNTLLTADYDRFFQINAKTLKVKKEVVFGDDWTISHFSRGDEGYILERSPDAMRVIIHLAKEENGNQRHRIANYDLISGKLVWKYEEPNFLGNPIFAENGAQVWCFNEAGILIKLDAKTGKILQKSAKIAYANALSTISPSGKYITNFINDTEANIGYSVLNVVETANLQLKFSVKKERVQFQNSMFFDEDRFFLTYDDQLKIWETATGNLIARVILIENTADWIVSAPDGRFDGSPEGLKKMHYVQGRESIPLEQLYEGFFTPNLLHELMYGDGKKSGKPVEIKDIKSPPTIKIIRKTTGLRNLTVENDAPPSFETSEKTVVLQLEADAKGNEIAEIRLFQNDKLLQISTRNLTVEDEKSPTREVTVTLVDGENRFRAVAINSQRTESRPDQISIFLKSPPVEAAQKKQVGATLHLVIIGINQYKNPKYSLNYAEADAKAVLDELKNNCGSVVNHCKEYYILNDKAVKTGIVAALESVASEAKSEDILVFYYAGHGVIDNKKSFFLVPHDVTQLYGADDALAQKGISAADLKAFSIKIKAQKQVFILDACQSSGAIESFSSRGAAEEKAIAQLARSTGTHWLTAAGSEQFASEFAQLGHGVFTFALLQAFAGGADNNGDGKITIKEIDAFLQDQVPILTEKYRGTPQYPSSYGFGQDFPVGIIRK
jgi:WD40 repeat protein